MTYLLDTDTLIFLIRGLKARPRQKARRERAAKLLDRCRQAHREGHALGVSAITAAELEFGARNGGRYEDEIAAVQKILTPFQVLDFDAVNCPPHYGRIRQDLEQAGETIGAMDLLIAAHALSLDATLVTGNLGHFQRISGLRVTDWR
jgi:tRNA(fMet)-specific endonuclease VapC